MKTPIRDLPRAPVPLTAVYAAALTCGVLAAEVMEVVLTRFGIELAGGWGNLFMSGALQLPAAGGWWLIAGAAFLASAVTAAALSRLPLPWIRFRALRWLLGAGAVLALAAVGHVGANPAMHGGALTSMAAMAISAVVALFGAYFAARR